METFSTDPIVGALTPYLGEMEEAKQVPNGHVYRIAGKFGPSDAIPPEAIIGAWKVNKNGQIVGSFIKNPKYDSKRWPS